MKQVYSANTLFLAEMRVTIERDDILGGKHMVHLLLDDSPVQHFKVLLPTCNLN